MADAPTPARPDRWADDGRVRRCRPVSARLRLRSRANHPATSAVAMRHLRVLGLIGLHNRCRHVPADR